MQYSDDNLFRDIGTCTDAFQHLAVLEVHRIGRIGCDTLPEDHYQYRTDGDSGTYWNRDTALQKSMGQCCHKGGSSKILVICL